MGFQTAITDVQGSDGASLVVANPDGTRPALVLKLGTGLAGSFAKSGDQGIVSVAPDSAAAVTTPSVTVGPTTWTSGPVVPTTDDSTVNLLSSALAVPASGTLRFRVVIEAKIATAAQTVEATYVLAYKYIRKGSAAPTEVWKYDLSNAEGSVNDPPYSLPDKQPITITGAANNGSGLVRLTVDDAAGIANGGSVTITGATTTGGLAINGVWSATYVDATHVDLRGSTWVGSWTSGGSIVVHGAVAVVVTGNAIQIQATGVKPPAWIQGEVVTFGALRYSGSGNTYLVTGNGTTNGSGTGPTGTGTGAADGTATVDYASAGQAVTIAWRVTKIEWSTT